MSIIGGAIFPAIMGYVSDASNIRWAFLVPLLCHVYVLYFAVQGYRPDPRLVETGGTKKLLVEG
jgi:FHS family L-fucose permease-like MFS transporter